MTLEESERARKHIKQFKIGDRVKYVNTNHDSGEKYLLGRTGRILRIRNGVVIDVEWDKHKTGRTAGMWSFKFKKLDMKRKVITL